MSETAYIRIHLVKFHNFYTLKKNLGRGVFACVLSALSLYCRCHCSIIDFHTTWGSEQVILYVACVFFCCGGDQMSLRANGTKQTPPIVSKNSLLCYLHSVRLFLCRPARCDRLCVGGAWWSCVVTQFLHVFSHDVEGDCDEALGPNTSHCDTQTIDTYLVTLRSGSSVTDLETSGSRILPIV